MITKVKKTSNFQRLTFFLVVVLFFPLQAAGNSPKKSEEDPYQKLIRIYSEFIRLEDAIFSKLTFELSPDQLVKDGSEPKLTLVDNFGRPWIFMPSPPGSLREYRATVGYRIYKLCGLNSPETQVITITLNGKIEEGSIQRYVEQEPGLKKITEYKLAPEAIKYLLRAQVLDWLLKSYDSMFDNFIILSQAEGVVDDLCRIDLGLSLSPATGEYNHDAMIYELKQQWFKKEKISYFWILEEYNSGKMDIDWKANLPFVEFVADLPDDFFKLQVLPAKIRDFSPPKEKNPRYDLFFDPLIKVKKNLREDFSRFYAGFEGVSDGGWYSPGSKEDEIDRICNNLSQGIEDLKIEEKKSRDFVVRPTKIEARICREGYEIVHKFRSDRARREKGWEPEFDRAWKSLSKLEHESSVQLEKEALQYYKQKLRKICSDKYTELTLTEINESEIAGE
jgi:hypothetical protein